MRDNSPFFPLLLIADRRGLTSTPAGILTGAFATRETFSYPLLSYVTDDLTA